MDDNSTPTRRNSGPPANSGFDLNRPTIISLLYLGSFVTGITGLVGIVLAHIWRGESHEPWISSHYTYLIRTFWIGFVASIIGAVLSIVLIGVPLLIATAVWVGVRSVLSLMKAQRHEPMPEPDTLLF
ncbi:DUF4870 family protein [Altererythrobacter sp. GH1-8]|uniref:DUF4870 family protein n=1 Tax=Altererythrobacter sp. GH1-8 TaxID=3349333 RepID=UPI00374C8BE3